MSHQVIRTVGIKKNPHGIHRGEVIQASTPFNTYHHARRAMHPWLEEPVAK